MKPRTLERLWDVDELAAYLGTGKRYVDRITQEGRILHFRIAKELSFRESDVLGFLSDQMEDVARPAISRPSTRPGRPRGSRRAGAR